MSNLISLPRHILFEILTNLNVRDLSQICKSSQIINNICKSQDFWQFKNLKELGEIDPRSSYVFNKINELTRVFKQNLANLFARVVNFDQRNQAKSMANYVYDDIKNSGYCEEICDSFYGLYNSHNITHVNGVVNPEFLNLQLLTQEELYDYLYPWNTELHKVKTESFQLHKSFMDQLKIYEQYKLNIQII